MEDSLRDLLQANIAAVVLLAVGVLLTFPPSVDLLRGR